MTPSEFQSLYKAHRAKLAEAWLALSDKDLEETKGRMDRFVAKVSKIYQIPPEVILRELEALRRSIEEGIETDFSPRLDPRE